MSPLQSSLKAKVRTLAKLKGGMWYVKKTKEQGSKARNRHEKTM